MVVPTKKKQKSRGRKNKTVPVVSTKITINGNKFTLKQALKILIEWETPSWLTTDIYSSTLKCWDKNQEKMKNREFFEDKLTTCLSLHRSEITFHREKDNTYHILNGISANTILRRFEEGHIISTPETGQDPKIVNKANTKTAQEHAGTHWEGEWKNPITLNLVMYSNGEIVISIVDGEHRIWGLIGFSLGIVALGHPKDKILFFESDKMSSKIQVNGLTLPQIVELANRNLKDADETISKYEVIERFNRYSIPSVVLPMYNKKECSSHFYDLNAKSSDKKIPQLMHSFSYESNDIIKSFSSIKNHNFGGSLDTLHHFYYNRFSETEKSQLKTFMISHLIVQFLNQGDFVNSSDSSIRDKFLSLKGYEGIFNSEMQNALIESLNFLENLYCEISTAKSPSSQKIQQLLKIRKTLSELNLRIYNKKKFIESFEFFVESNIKKDDNSRTEFGANMYYSGKKNAQSAWEFIRANFLGTGTFASTKTYDKFNEIGIKPIGSKIPRLFDSSIIMEANKKYNNTNIDGSIFEKKPEGGHRISDWELDQLSNKERDDAAKEEGGFTDDKFNHAENCRPICKYHNNRQGELRLSRYLEIMNESDEFVNQERQKYRAEVLARISE